MSKRFAILQCETWNDEGFVELSNDARLLFLWGWSNPQAAICGLYEVQFPASHMAAAIGDVTGGSSLTNAERIARALRELEAKPLMFFDERHGLAELQRGVVWVVNRCFHSNTSAKAAEIMAREWCKVPDGPLKDAFYARYGDALRLDAVMEAIG